MSPTAYQNMPDIAVFVDIENFCGYCEELGMPVDLAPEIEALAQTGRIVDRRSVGDITALPQPLFNHRKVRQMLQANHVQHQDVPHLSYFKNSADIQLVVDVMHLALTTDITHFAILANDRDFVPLFLKLRSMGRTVIGCGPSQAGVNAYYRSACDRFYFHDELVGRQKSLRLAVTVEPATAPATAPATESRASSDDDFAPLLQVLQTFAAEGRQARATVVGQRLRLMFPDFDPKQTFKNYCRRMAAKGKVVLSNLDAPDFVLATQYDIPDLSSPTVATESVMAPAAPTQVEIYQDWCRSKLRMAMPPPSQRNIIYCALVDIMAARRDTLPIQLKTLAQLVGEQLSGAEATAFRILYGLFRSHALVCTLTEDSFNPAIAGLGVQAEQLDSYFVANTLAVFQRDNTGLSFDAAAWSLLFYQDASAAWLIRDLCEWGPATTARADTSPATLGATMMH